MEIEIMNAISSEIGYEIVFKNMQFVNLMPSLTAGEVDCIIGGLVETTERKKIANASLPLYTDISAGSHDSVVIYVNLNQKDLLNEINLAIKTLRANGVLNEIVEKYIELYDLDDLSQENRSFYINVY